MAETGFASFEEFLSQFSPELAEEARYEMDLTRALATLRALREASGLSIREVSRRMGYKSTSTVQRLLDEQTKGYELDTMFRFARACGYSTRLEFEKVGAAGTFARASALRLWSRPKACSMTDSTTKASRRPTPRRLSSALLNECPLVA